VDPIERIEGATAVASERVAGVIEADLSRPTPCSEFDVRALLNHVIGGLAMLTTAAEGGKAEIPQGADSSGGRDKSVESFRWSLPCKGLAWTLVEQGGDGV